jgi:hypothetical protein
LKITSLVLQYVDVVIDMRLTTSRFFGKCLGAFHLRLSTAALLGLCPLRHSTAQIHCVYVFAAGVGSRSRRSNLKVKLLRRGSTAITVGPAQPGVKRESFPQSTTLFRNPAAGADITAFTMSHYGEGQYLSDTSQ